MANKLKILDLSYDSFIGDCLIFYLFIIIIFFWGGGGGVIGIRCFPTWLFYIVLIGNWDHVLFILSIVEFGFYLYFFFISRFS